jgi:hypothetical protein
MCIFRALGLTRFSLLRQRMRGAESNLGGEITGRVNSLANPPEPSIHEICKKVRNDCARELNWFGKRRVSNWDPTSALFQWYTAVRSPNR